MDGLIPAGLAVPCGACLPLDKELIWFNFILHSSFRFVPGISFVDVKI